MGKNGPRCGFPAIPLSAVKIASERRCAILVHSVLEEKSRSIPEGGVAFQQPSIFPEKKTKNRVLQGAAPRGANLSASLKTCHPVSGTP